MAFGRLGSLGAGFGRMGTGGQLPIPNFINDGSSLPWSQGWIVPNGLYVSSTNTTWFCWEGWQTVNGNLQRVAEVATYNHTTKLWSSSYIAGTRTILNDVHGIPTLARDSAGYVYLFYGCHNGSVKVSASASPDDPTIWNDFYTLSGTWTFPCPYTVGSTIYLFTSGTGAGTGQQEAIYVTPITTSSGVPTFGTSKALFDAATAGNDAWLPLATFVVVSTNIHFVFPYGATIGDHHTDGGFYAIYDTTTGNVSNWSGGTVVAPASQPIGKTSMDSNFRIYTTTRNSSPELAIIGTTSHVVYGDGATGTVILKHISATGGGAWSAATELFTFPAAVDARNVTAGPVPNAAGGLDVYFGDGSAGYTFPLSGNTTAGNMMKATRSSGGVWTSATLFYAMRGKGLDNPQPIENATANARLMFNETSSDESTIDGTLRGWVYGDGGFIRRSPIVVVPQPANPVSDFLGRANAIATLDTTHSNAYTNLIDALRAAGVWTKLDCLYVLATSNASIALLNLVNSSYTLTAIGSPTFTTDRGYTGVNAGSQRLDSNFVPSTNGVNYTLNSASLFGWSLTTSSPFSGDNIGRFVSGGNSALLSFPSGTTLGSRINASAGFPTLATASDIGFYGASRTSSSNVELYFNSSHLGSTTSTSTALPTASLYLLTGSDGDGCAAQVGIGGWASALTNTDWSNLYAACHTYMQTIAGVA